MFSSPGRCYFIRFPIGGWKTLPPKERGREQLVHAFFPIVIFFFFQNASRVAGVSVGLVGRDVELDGRE